MKTNTESHSPFRDFMRFMSYARSRYFLYFTSMFFMIISGTLMLTTSAFASKYLIDAVGSGNQSELRIAAWVGIGGIVVTALIYLPSVYTQNSQAKYLVADIRKLVYRHRAKLPVSYFENVHSGDFVSRLLYDTDNACDIYGAKLRQFVTPFFSCILQLIPMLFLSVRLTSILFGINLIFLFCSTRFATPIQKVSMQLSKGSAVMLERLVNLIDGASVVKSFGAGDEICAEFSAANTGFREKSVRQGKILASMEATNYGFELLTGLAFLVVAAIFVQYGWTTFGTLVGLIMLQKALSTSMLRMGRNISTFSSSLVSARRIFEFLDQPVEPEHYEGEAAAPDEAYIEMRSVSFSYTPEKLLFEQFNFKVGQGRKVALTGHSGAGKSTIAKLLLGFYPLTSGKIIIDGESYPAGALRNLREKIAYVPQEPYLYNDTILNNIRYGKLDATDDEVVAAAQAANAHDFILIQPHGYETVAGERGAQLSGGQRQRIAIARAILKNAPILILDEATSALDNESEHLVQEAIYRLMKGRTTIIIAHRPSTIASADEVFWIN